MTDGGRMQGPAEKLWMVWVVVGIMMRSCCENSRKQNSVQFGFDRVFHTLWMLLSGSVGRTLLLQPLEEFILIPRGEEEAAQGGQGIGRREGGALQKLQPSALVVESVRKAAQGEGRQAMVLHPRGGQGEAPRFEWQL